MTEQAAYVNAVSDRLIVSLFKTKVVYQVFSKDSLLKWQYVLDQSNTYPDLIKSAIFSSSTLVCSGMPFSLVPLGDSEPGLHFMLNHGISNDVLLQESEIFTIAYGIPSFFASTTPKIVGLQTTSDIHLLYLFLAQKSFNNAVFFYCQADEITIMAWKNGRFTLANRYSNENVDETFYYVMMVIEQLELPPNQLHFECLCTKGMHENYYTIFKDYVSTLHLSTSTASLQPVASAEHKEEELLAYFFAQCVL